MVRQTLRKTEIRLRVYVAAVLVLLVSRTLVAAEDTPAIVIRDVSLFDSAAGVTLPGRTVVIVGETIREVGTAGREIKIPDGARVIDGAGKFVIPGLMDAHVHLVHLADRTRGTGDRFLPLFLAAGVTSVRSAGDSLVAEAGVAHFAAEHPERCPRVFMASPLVDGAKPFHRDIGFSLADVTQVPEFVEVIS